MNDDKLRIQVNNFDTYQSNATHLDRLCDEVYQVPIIRVYGSLVISKQSYNVLVHIHNYYPYVYIEYDDEEEVGNAILKDLEEYIEEKLSDSFKRTKDGDEYFEEASPFDNGHEETNNGGTRKRKYVAQVQVCKGTPAYGYHLGYSLFYKISLLSPVYKSRLIKLIHEREITLNEVRKKNGMPLKSKRIELYEAHIPYLLQFSTDFNIFGCGWMESDKCYFRYPLLFNHQHNGIKALKEGLKPFINSRNILHNRKYERMGKMLLEIDITTTFILNRDYLEHRILHNNFKELGDHKNKVKNNTIYLPSLVHLKNDMEYQCELRNSLHLLKSPGLATGNPELDSTVWSNDGELMELLDYARKLNSYTNLNYSEYAEKKVHTEFNYPTSFELIDLERHSQKFESLQFFDDLLIWEKYNNLFDENALTSQTQEIGTPPIDQSFNSSKPSVTQRNTSNFEDDQFLAKSDDNDFYNDDMINTDTDNEDIDIPDASNIQNDQETLLEITQTNHRNSTNLDVFTSCSTLTDKSTQVDDKPIGYKASDYFYSNKVPTHLLRGNISRLFDIDKSLRVDYNDPFYEEFLNVSKRSYVFANRKIVVPCKNDACLPRLPMSEAVRSVTGPKLFTGGRETKEWQYLKEPPSKLFIKKWVQEEEIGIREKRRRLQSQIGSSVFSSKEYKFSYNSEKVARKPNSFSKLTNMTIELHVNTFVDLLPNPNSDCLTFIFYGFDDANENLAPPGFKKGILFHNNNGTSSEKINRLSSATGISIEVFSSEAEMIERLLEIIEVFDPDILSGYEVNANSWGYLIERFGNVFDMNLLPQLSRCVSKGNGKLGDRWGYSHTSNIKINGRFVLNIWRLVKSDLSLSNYSLENVSYHLLHKTLPKYSNLDLTKWLDDADFSKNLLVLQYYLTRLDVIIKIIDVQEFITRNVENSRLIGIDFDSNFYRGSQFKVESILTRIAKSENLILNSPSKEQVHKLKPIEYIPLILEPESNYYKSPMVVLDFQSLYPSIIIAYNYCYSTLLGKLDNFKQSKNKVGHINLSLPSGLVDLLSKENSVNVSPNGCVFVKKSVRKSLLAKMLSEIIDIRIKIKKMMHEFRDDSELLKLYNSKQAALKLIAAVTYGYTSATFSGRMPSTELSDAIVATGREILNQSIDYINNGEFGAKVVYGDTDSLFVYFPGKSRSDAFEIGQMIAKSLTDRFPDPIKLKFEKVYHPCVLLTKKRYVGYSYEFVEQQEPKFDAKGIETVRRDGIPAQQMLVEKALRILFNTQNLSEVKKYTLGEFKKIIQSQVFVGDFCFAKEVRLGAYKNEKSIPPGALVAQRSMSNDPRKEPQYKERIPYVVINNPLKRRVKDRCVSPEEFVESYTSIEPMFLDHEYYITRVLIPPLARIFNLIGVDIKSWYLELPKSIKSLNSDSKSSLSKLAKSRHCVLCANQLEEDNISKVCNNCTYNDTRVVNRFMKEKRELELKQLRFDTLCNICKYNQNLKIGASGLSKDTTDHCINNSCKIYYKKFRTKNEFKSLLKLESEVTSHFDW